MHQYIVQGISGRALHLTFVSLKVIFWTNGIEFNVFSVFQSRTDFEVHSVQHIFYKFG
jgi:hypothetical protein